MLFRSINDYKYKNNGWDLYSTWFALFDYQIYRGNYYEALIITSQMSDYAQKNNHKPGIAISNLAIAKCYYVYMQVDESKEYYTKAFVQLDSLDHPFSTASVLFNISNIHIDNEDYLSALSICDSALEYINKWELKYNIPNYNLRARYSIAKTRAYLGLGNITLSELYRASSNFYFSLFREPSLFDQITFATALIEDKNGNYKNVVQLISKLIDKSVNDKNYPQMLKYYKIMGNKSYENMDYTRSLDVFRKFSIAIDSANVELSSSSFNRIIGRIELNKLIIERDNEKIEKDKAIHRTKTTERFAYFILLACLFLVSILILVIALYKVIKIKNKELLKQIMEKDKKDDYIDIIENELPIEENDQKKILFKKIKDLVKDKEILSIQELNREMLAEMLGTNGTYIADAIRDNRGITFSAYINKKRVKYARELIDNNPDLSLDDVSFKCGFSSRSRFNNAVKE